VITADAHPAYFVDLRFFGPTIDPSFQRVLRGKGAHRGDDHGDIPDTPVNALDIVPVRHRAAPLTETIDTRGLPTVDSIDGPGKVLGSSGPVTALKRRPGTDGRHAFRRCDFQNLRTTDG